MKKMLSLLLVAVLMCMAAYAVAEDWTCPTCGSTASSKFCEECGTAKPSTDWICPNCQTLQTGKFCEECGTAKTAATNPAPVPVTVDQPADDADAAFKRAVNYTAKPITDAEVESYTAFGETAFTVLMNNGETYMVVVINTEGIYAIEVMDTTSSDYTPTASPFNTKDEAFVEVLNFLMSKDNLSIVSIEPMVADIYTAKDSAGNSYILSIVCSPALVTISLAAQ